jgi:hypothetical protein
MPPRVRWGGDDRADLAGAFTGQHSQLQPDEGVRDVARRELDLVGGHAGASVGEGHREGQATALGVHVDETTASAAFGVNVVLAGLFEPDLGEAAGAMTSIVVVVLRMVFMTSPLSICAAWVRRVKGD